MREQGIEVCANVLHQDNKRVFLLKENGKSTSGKKTHMLDIWYFMITDQVEHSNLSIACFLTDDMEGNFMLKGLKGGKSVKFRKNQGNSNLITNIK